MTSQPPSGDNEFEGLDVVQIDSEDVDVKVIRNLDEDDPVRVASHLRRAHAVTARRLAYALVATLVGSYLLHYGVTTWLNVNGHESAVAPASEIYEKWLPVISGLTGSAVTYFLTREQR